MLATLNALAAFPDQLEAHYSAIPAAYRHWAPATWAGIPSEPFTAIEQLCHVRDIEVDGYQLRLRRTLEEDNPLLISLDGEAMARERRYAEADADSVLADFRRARDETLALIASIGAEQFRRPARFEGYGQLTLRSLVHYLCSHDQQHLAGLQWLLGKIEAGAQS
ncbi:MULTISPECIES: DinB family protein [unclassified Pseudomonas]|uniref:DinB family protein n=1 Tax=unclassified Pseudomonas TaxID=196821 RepID=UPI002449D9B5|nr:MULTISPECIES: DinB family protein [unclassified Pseudomonas]MDG9923145.1 DinB family protein [Pseudomonas sp. GD04045]MDH0034778.1 DinB family protein [Pseudomonas sp. GD04019]